MSVLLARNLAQDSHFRACGRAATSTIPARPLPPQSFERFPQSNDVPIPFSFTGDSPECKNLKNHWLSGILVKNPLSQSGLLALQNNQLEGICGKWLRQF